MNRFHNDCILAEKKMNTIPNADKTSKTPVPPSSTSTTTTGATKRAPLTKAYSCSDASSDNYGFITPKQFVDLVNQNPNGQDLPILDCRSQMDFGSERIRTSHNINCRTKIMARKLTSKRLEDVEPNLSSSLNRSDTVIIYDQSTDVRGDDKISALPINLVVQAAQKSNKRVQIIQGGLDAVKTEFPHLIECPTDEFKDKLDSDLPPPPPSPDAIDKENVVMSQILPHIFVGNTSDAQDLGRLNEHNITHILNCTPDLPFLLEEKYKCMRIDVLDLPTQNIRKHFDQAIEFIESALRSKGNVLVHCSAGISRSPTLVLAYMMKKNHWTLEESFDKMRKLRQIVDPNVSFIVQLKEWEKHVMSTPVTNETNDDNSGTTNTSRATSNIYCGSTSKNKTDNKSHNDSVIIVN